MDGMLSSWIKVYFLIVMSLNKGLQAYPDHFQCSCYTLDHGRPKSWSYGRQQCGRRGGELVSMETVEEWEFIKTQIQYRTTGYFDEWWIGLKERDGRWEWLSNHSLTYNKWRPHGPNKEDNEKCVVIAKNYPPNTYGLFNNAGCGNWKGWICEYQIKDCSNDQVKWCKNPVSPTVMTLPERDSETTATTSTTITSSTTKATTTSDRKTAASDFTITTSVRQSTTMKTTTNYDPNVPSPSATTASNKDQTAASEYPTPTTTPYNKYTEMSTTTTETDNSTTTAVSQTTKKPFSTLTIIIPVLVVSAVVFLCCGVLCVCVCGWKRKRKGKLQPSLKHDGTNTDHNTSDVMVGSSRGLHVNEHELKAIVIQPNNACAQDDSHATHGNSLDNSTDTKEDTKSSHGLLVSQMTHDALEMPNYSDMTSLESTDKESNQNKAKNDSSNPTGKSPQEHMDLTPDDTVGKENTAKVSDIYATVDKSKKKNKTTEVVYAEVKKRSKNPV